MYHLQFISCHEHLKIMSVSCLLRLDFFGMIEEILLSNSTTYFNSKNNVPYFSKNIMKSFRFFVKSSQLLCNYIVMDVLINLSGIERACINKINDKNKKIYFTVVKIILITKYLNESF